MQFFGYVGIYLRGVMRIGYLGAGTWGYCLASLLAGKGYRVRLWAREAETAAELNQNKKHPKLPMGRFKGDLMVTTDLNEVLSGADLVVESVTSEGIRPSLGLRRLDCLTVLF